MNSAAHNYGYDEPIKQEICNVDEEAAIIGTLLMNNDAFSIVAGVLEPRHFSEPLLGKVFEVIGDFIRQGKKALPATIKTYLEWEKQIGWIKDEFGKPLTLGKVVVRAMTEFSMPVVVLPQLVESTKAHYKRRVLARIGDKLIAAAYDVSLANDDPTAIGEDAISEISNALSEGDEIYGAVSFGSALDDALEDTNRAYSGKKAAGVTYRFKPVEKLIGPLTGGQLIIIGGATKQGKSALAGQLGVGAALDGFPVWQYSGELTAKEVVMRENSRETKISVKRQKRGKVTEADFETLVAYRNAHRNLPIFIQTNKLTLDQIEERIRFFVAKKGKGLVIIDHIGLIARAKGQERLENWAFGEVATSRLKEIALAMDIPIIACVQLKKNTFADYRPTINEKFFHQLLAKKPKYADLIGAVERDADHVLIPFRPVVFLKEHEPAEHSDLFPLWQDLVSQNEDKAKIYLALSRENHWPNQVETGWHGPTTTFVDLGGMNEPELIKREVIDNPMGLGF